MSKKPVDFEEVKTLLLTKNIQELETFIKTSNKKQQETSMFLFWAIDYFEQHPKEIPRNSIQKLKKNSKFLFSIQEVIINQELGISLNDFSQGFVLGSLEFAIREREAQISRYKEYIHLIEKIKQWPNLGFPDEDFQKEWEQRMVSIEEIQDWMNSRAKKWYPIVLMLINSKKYQKSTKIILKTLRKGRKDDVVFQILSAILHSNPILHQRIEYLCNERDISFLELQKKMDKTVEFLFSDTPDKKVQNLCKLFLNMRKEVI